MKAFLICSVIFCFVGLNQGTGRVRVRHVREAVARVPLSQSVLDDRANFLKNWHEAMKVFRDEKPSEYYEQPASSSVSSPGLKTLEPTDVVFNCSILPRSPTVPTSVHALRPGDIDIVAAMGDSITAGNGVRARMDMAWQTAIPNRGESFSVGGERSLDEGVITIHNILRKYNENVTGGSHCARTRMHGYAGYNIAIPGDTNRGMERQARDLIEKLLDTLDIEEYFNSWKLVTLLIGGNDLCQHCLPGNNYSLSAEGYAAGIKRGLDLLNQWLPRAFVNLQIMADVSVVRDLKHPGFEDRCDRLHEIECPCAMNNDTHPNLKQLQLDYYHHLLDIVKDDWYDNRDDFTVVIQPFLLEQPPFSYENGTYDMTFFAPDCFHPGVKTHQAMAIGLWNNMLQPVGQKDIRFDETQMPHYICPTEAKPYFYTNKNSGPAAVPPFERNANVH